MLALLVIVPFWPLFLFVLPFLGLEVHRDRQKHL